MFESLVSIVVPVYNVENYLHECVNSILTQSYGNFELILVDDGSTDKSAGICEEYATCDTRIIVVHKANGGVSSARNMALDIAQGKYVIFVDSDDYVEPNYIERLLEYIEGNANLDFVECGYRKVGMKHGEYNHPNEMLLLAGQHYESYLSSKALDSLVWNKIYTKASIGNLRFEEGKTMEDAIFLDYYFSNPRLKGAIIPDVLYNYRIRTGSIMTRRFALSHMLSSFYQQQVNIAICEQYYPHLISTAKDRLFSDMLQYINLYHKKRLDFSFRELQCSIFAEFRKNVMGGGSILLKIKVLIFITFPKLYKYIYKR